MKRVVLQEFVTLDGFAAGPNNNVDFIPASMGGDTSFGEEQVALMEKTDTLLLGRITYAMFAGYWPNVTQGAEQPFADKWNGLSKVIFSKTLDRAPWGKWSEGRIVRGNAVDEVTRLKKESGKDMLISGSISLAQSLIDKGLVDEYRLVVCPVVLGKGRPLFRDNAGPIQMELVNAKAKDRGAVSLVYRYRGAAVD
jgi:dihydrofolate reductase